MYLLDTNVVFELRKTGSGKCDRNVASWSRSVSADSLFLSVITVQELEIGVLLAERRDPTKAAILRRWLHDHVLPAFERRILPVDMAVARCSAALHVQAPRPFRDGLIAATALIHGFVVVTRNVPDFVSTNVPLINPWDAN